MLRSSEPEVRRAATRQIALAAFRHREAGEDLRGVLEADEECRRAAAEVYSLNVHHETVREICAGQLTTLFGDPSKRVREAARDWLRGRSGPWTEWQRDLLNVFIQSSGFPEAGAECAINFEQTPGPMPPEFLSFAKRAVAVFEEQIKVTPRYALGIAYRLPALLIRFYEQSKDAVILTQCLDLLDRMLGLGWGEATTELRRLDR